MIHTPDASKSRPVQQGDEHDDAEYPMTVRDAAVYLGVSVQTVYLWVERKQIPHLRVMGRNIRFLKSDLEPFRATFKRPAFNGTGSRVYGTAHAAPKLRTVEQEEL